MGAVCQPDDVVPPNKRNKQNKSIWAKITGSKNDCSSKEEIQKAYNNPGKPCVMSQSHTFLSSGEGFADPTSSPRYTCGTIQKPIKPHE